MTEKSNFGSTQTKLLGSILQFQVIKTTYHVLCLIKSQDYCTVTQKIKQLEFGIFRQRLILIGREDKETDIGY